MEINVPAMCALEVVIAKKIPWRGLLCWGFPQGCRTCPWGAFPQAALPIALGLRGLCRLAWWPLHTRGAESGCLRGSSLEEQFGTWVTCPQSPMFPIHCPPTARIKAHLTLPPSPAPISLHTSMSQCQAPFLFQIPELDQHQDCDTCCLPF